MKQFVASIHALLLVVNLVARSRGKFRPGTPFWSESWLETPPLRENVVLEKHREPVKYPAAWGRTGSKREEWTGFKATSEHWYRCP